MKFLVALLFTCSFCFSQTKRVAVLPVGADMTVNIKSVVSDSQIKTIELERPGGGDIVINGTVDLEGKVLKFGAGTKITGKFKIRNAVIDAGYNQHIFTNTGTLENVTVSGTLVSVKWFGAKGDGVTDDQPAIQAAGEAVIKNNSLPRGLFFPWGSYKCNKELFFYNWTGADYGFFSLNLIGQEGAYFNNTLTEAKIIANHTKTFAIGYQLARSSLIKGLVIEGQFNPTGSGNYREYVSRPYETWASAFGVQDNPTAPYSGIAIDPVDNSNTLGATGRYSGLSHLYRGSGSRLHSGSSGIKIEQCRISNFAVGIAVSLNSITSNAENVHIIDCSIDIAKTAVAYGQDQTKDNFIIRCITWDRVHTLVDTKNYGRGTGQAPYVDGWNIAGDVIQLWQFNPLRAACSWRNIFAESLWRIGDGDAGAGFSLESSTINFNMITNPILIPSTHLTGSKMVFKGCVIKYYDNLYNKRMRMTGADYRFEDCELDRLPLFNPSYGFERLTPAQFVNCITGDGQLGKPHAKGQYSSPNNYVAYGNLTLEEGGLLQGSAYNFIKDFKITINCGWPAREQRIDLMTITVNEQARTAVLSGLSGSNYQYQIAAGDYITSEAGRVYGRVISVNRSAGTANLVDVPLGIQGSFRDHVITHWVDRIAGQFIGDVTSGSEVITNCEYDILLPKPYVGQRLKTGHSFIPLIVDNISGSNITMSWKADYTQKGVFNPWVQFGSQNFELSTTFGTGETGNWPVLIPEGAKLYQRINKYSTRNTTSICTKSGFGNAKAIGKINQAQWKVLE